MIGRRAFFTKLVAGGAVAIAPKPSSRPAAKPAGAATPTTPDVEASLSIDLVHARSMHRDAKLGTLLGSELSFAHARIDNIRDVRMKVEDALRRRIELLERARAADLQAVPSPCPDVMPPPCPSCGLDNYVVAAGGDTFKCILCQRDVVARAPAAAPYALHAAHCPSCGDQMAFVGRTGEPAAIVSCWRCEQSWEVPRHELHARSVPFKAPW